MRNEFVQCYCPQLIEFFSGDVRFVKRCARATVNMIVPFLDLYLSYFDYDRAQEWSSKE